MQLSDIWTVAGIIFGFQITWFSWRVSREIKMRSQGQLTWLPLADWVNIISMVLTAIGVFVLPAIGVKNLETVKRIFAFSVLLIVGHAFALVGHYQLFTKKKVESQYYYTFQEILVILIIIAITIVYVIFSIAT